MSYLDTSAIVPMIIEERSTAACRSLWESSETLVTSQIAFVEGAAALAHARRIGRIGSSAHRASLAALDELWSHMTTLPVSEDLIARAASLADSRSLRGGDAVHCASAIQVCDIDMVAAAGDQQLLAAWRDLGVQTVDING